MTKTTIPHGSLGPRCHRSRADILVDRVHHLLTRDPGAYWPRQYDNPDNVDAYAGLAHELIEQLGRVDVLVCSVGTGGHSAGVAKVLRRLCRRLLAGHHLARRHPDRSHLPRRPRPLLHHDLRRRLLRGTSSAGPAADL
ncbi:pyridoxal-phosphate dependent enzyme [Microbispora sp. H10830]|uniref:pyridoxal-phosphate dependent enzyme n=1 Tax=Microbispora sp. H10830 TaxID=2729109 RepID=UPI002872B231|nr:pyridoxal-phosphate dependent enzyme [Microbispora sp. H10830]